MRDADDEGSNVVVALGRERKKSKVNEMLIYDANMFLNADSCNWVRK